MIDPHTMANGETLMISECGGWVSNGCWMLNEGFLDTQSKFDWSEMPRCAEVLEQVQGRKFNIALVGSFPVVIKNRLALFDKRGGVAAWIDFKYWEAMRGIDMDLWVSGGLEPIVLLVPDSTGCEFHWDDPNNLIGLLMPMRAPTLTDFEEEALRRWVP